ncbi:hypothetical protein ABHI18_011691, partial [Aspergillus niger]
MLLYPIPSPAVLEPGKDQVQSYIAEMNPKILPPPARKATNPLELLQVAISTGRRRAQAKHILQLPDDPVILTHSCMTCTFQGVNTAHLYLMDQLSALISCSPPPTPLPMNRNRRADDLGALMLPSGSTGFSKALDCAEPRRFLDLVDRHRIFLGFAPNLFLALLYDRICRSTPKQEAQPAPTWGLSGLRCVFSGGEPTVRQLLPRLVHHVRQRLPRCPRQLYITGRFNNTLLLNGETIFPVEVECSLEQLRSGRCPSHTFISKEPRSVCSPDPTSGVLDPEREVQETSIQAHRQVTAQLPPRPPSIPYSPSRLRAPRRQSGRRQRDHLSLQPGPLLPRLLHRHPGPAPDVRGCLTPPDLLMEPTVADLARCFASQEHSSPSRNTEDTTHEYVAMIPLQLSGPQTPLWLVHSASGNVLIFANIARCPRLPSGLSPLARKCGSWARWDGPPDIADLVSRLTWNKGLVMVGYFYELNDEP